MGNKVNFLIFFFIYYNRPAHFLYMHYIISWILLLLLLESHNKYVLWSMHSEKVTISLCNSC